MTYQTKNPAGGLGFPNNRVLQNGSSLHPRARLEATTRQLFLAGLIPASWVADIAKIGGFNAQV